MKWFRTDGKVRAVTERPKGARLRNRLREVLPSLRPYIIAWKLCTTMRADDVTETLTLALAASGCDRAEVARKPRLLSDNGLSYIAGDLAGWLKDQGMHHVRGAPKSSPDPGQD